MVSQQDIAVSLGGCNGPSGLGPSISHPVIKMAIACAKEQDHVAIARKIDTAFHLYKYQVESINAKPADARRQRAAYEALLDQTVKRLLEENSALDRKGGPHDIWF